MSSPQDYHWIEKIQNKNNSILLMSVLFIKIR